MQIIHCWWSVDYVIHLWVTHSINGGTPIAGWFICWKILKRMISSISTMHIHAAKQQCLAMPGNACSFFFARFCNDNPVVSLQDGFEMGLAGLQRPWPNGSVVVGRWRKIPVIIIHVNPDEILQPQAEYPWILGSHEYIYIYTMIHHELHTIMPLQSILAFESIIISSLNRLNQNPSPKKRQIKVYCSGVCHINKHLDIPDDPYAKQPCFSSLLRGVPGCALARCHGLVPLQQPMKGWPGDAGCIVARPEENPCFGKATQQATAMAKMAHLHLCADSSAWDPVVLGSFVAIFCWCILMAGRPVTPPHCTTEALARRGTPGLGLQRVNTGIAPKNLRYYTEITDSVRSIRPPDEHNDDLGTQGEETTWWSASWKLRCGKMNTAHSCCWRAPHLTVYGVRCRSTPAGAGGMLRRLNPIKCPDELPHNGTGLNEWLSPTSPNPTPSST